MLLQNLITCGQLCLVIVVLSSGTLLVEADNLQQGTYLTRDLCNHVGTGSNNVFYRHDIDYCECQLEKGTLHCQGLKKDYSDSKELVIGTFDASLPSTSPRLSNFLYLFATEACDVSDTKEAEVFCHKLFKHETYDISSSLQLGLATCLALDINTKTRDTFIPEEFEKSVTTFFPQEGANRIPAHCYKDFSIRIDAPAVFKSIRHVQNIDEAEFILSIGNSRNRLNTMGKLGGSKNGFYLTHDDKYFIKTTYSHEYENSLKILPSYFRYINRNPHSLLSTFICSFQYKSSQLDSSFFITENLLPSDLENVQKFDLKGSTTHRKTTEKEIRTKKSITYKDLDFLESYPDGFYILPPIYEKLMRSLYSDVDFLHSQNCLDYSLLVGVVDATEGMLDGIDPTNLRIIPAQTRQGQDKLLYIGIIDILQAYSSRKKLESNIKQMIYEKSTLSIIEPNAYSIRFKKFISEKVFKTATLSEMFKISD